MPDTHRILCVDKLDGVNPTERIRCIGGTNPDGTRWKLSVASAMLGIEAGTWRFFVRVNGQCPWVVIAVHDGQKYLRTELDGAQPLTLLDLPDCP